MPHAANNEIVGVNWGSSNFRAYRIAADGAPTDEYSLPAGVASLDREGMAAAMNALVARWPDHGPIYASGMIGSNIGWTEVPYALAPASLGDLAHAAVATGIGSAAVRIIPGIACRRDFDGAPDILRGEEVELLGLMALTGADGLVALPGTHTKWARIGDGRVLDFLTSMSGEIFDRLTAQGLLASIVEGEAADGPAFVDGVAAGRARRLGLGTLLFGARARVIRGELDRRDAASYIRGLLIGSEIADALELLPDLGTSPIPLVGNAALSCLYVSALRSMGIASDPVDSRLACLHGFRALHRASIA